jgi:hypothetical protein
MALFFLPGTAVHGPYSLPEKMQFLFRGSQGMVELITTKQTK